VLGSVAFFHGQSAILGGDELAADLKEESESGEYDLSMLRLDAFFFSTRTFGEGDVSQKVSSSIKRSAVCSGVEQLDTLIVSSAKSSIAKTEFPLVDFSSF
jgi:hypothetical protein